MTDQQAYERRIFEAFVAVCPVMIEPESIQHPLPPAPDILCKRSTCGEVAFELVQLVDKDVAQRLSGAMTIKHELIEAIEDLPDAGRSRVRQMDIALDFCAEATLRKRRGSIPSVVGALEELAVGYEGDVLLAPSVNRVVKTLNVKAGGPLIHVSSFSTYKDPALASIGAKFEKHYESAAPIELLAVYDLQDDLPPAYWLDDVRAFVEAEIAASPFQRVWVFRYPDGPVLYCHPPT